LTAGSEWRPIQRSNVVSAAGRAGRSDGLEVRRLGYIVHGRVYESLAWTAPVHKANRGGWPRYARLRLVGSATTVTTPQAISSQPRSETERQGPVGARGPEYPLTPFRPIQVGQTLN